MASDPRQEPFPSVDIDPALYQQAMDQHALDVAARAASAAPPPPRRQPVASLATSARGGDFIKAWEGSRSHVYGDVATNPTIGYGHLVKPGEQFPHGLTADQRQELFTADLGRHEQIVRDAVNVPLTQGEFDALVSLAYNIPAALRPRSTLLKLLNAGDYEGAARQFDVWNMARKDGRKTVIPGLAKRRGAERTVFQGGDYRGP